VIKGQKTKRPKGTRINKDKQGAARQGYLGSGRIGQDKQQINNKMFG
jgi:hypothetical protein